MEVFCKFDSGLPTRLPSSYELVAWHNFLLDIDIEGLIVSTQDLIDKL